MHQSADDHAELSHQTVEHGGVSSFAFSRGENLAGGLLEFDYCGSVGVVFLSETCRCFAHSCRVHNRGGADVIGRLNFMGRRCWWFCWKVFPTDYRWLDCSFGSFCFILYGRWTDYRT